LQGLEIDRSQATISKLVRIFRHLLNGFDEQGNYQEKTEEDAKFLSFIIGQFEHPAHGNFRVLLSVEN
jgi:hypothetical protein